MDVSTLTKTLSEVGLSENQAKVYLALLQLGTASPSAIAREAGVKRTTTYPVLESLLGLGLIAQDAQSFKKKFSAENPERLDALVETRRDQLRKSLGELSALFNLRKGESALKFVEGKESIKTVYNGLLEDVKDGDDYYIISSPDEWYALDPEFLRDFIQRRAQRNLAIKGLLLDSKLGREYIAKQEEYNLQAKLFPKGITFRANIVIIPTKVIIHQLQAPIWAIIIENREIVRVHQELFELLWRFVPEK